MTTHDLPHLFATPVASQRDFLRTAGCGLGTLTLTGLLDAETKSIDPLSAHPEPFAGKAKSVIWIFANGGPSHVDTWDYELELVSGSTSVKRPWG